MSFVDGTWNEIMARLPIFSNSFHSKHPKITRLMRCWFVGSTWPLPSTHKPCSLGPVAHSGNGAWTALGDLPAVKTLYPQEMINMVYDKICLFMPWFWPWCKLVPSGCYLKVHNWQIWLKVAHFGCQYPVLATTLHSLLFWKEDLLIQVRLSQLSLFSWKVLQTLDPEFFRQIEW